MLRINRRGDAQRSSPERILVVKLAGLGDAVLMLQPIRALRRRCPRAYIEMLAAPLTAGVFHDEPSLNRLTLYDLFGTQRGLRQYFRLLRDLRRKKFDMVVDFEQHIKMVAVTSWLTEASRRIGLAGPGNSRRLMLTDAIPLDGKSHMACFFHELAEHAGAIDVGRESSKLMIDKASSSRVEAWFQSVGLKKSDIIVGMHTGSGVRAKSRKWLPERFAELINGLQERVVARVILTGSAMEREDLEYIARRCKVRPILACQDLSVKELAYLISLMTAFISNDTGPMHIGPAMATPTIALFGPQDPRRYGPLGPDHKALYRPPSCSPCIQIHLGAVPECKKGDSECMNNLQVEEVLAALLDILTSRKEVLPLSSLGRFR